MHLYSKSTSGDRKQNKLQQPIRPKMAFISLRMIHARLPGPLTKVLIMQDLSGAFRY